MIPARLAVLRWWAVALARTRGYYCLTAAPTVAQRKPASLSGSHLIVLRAPTKRWANRAPMAMGRKAVSETATAAENVTPQKTT
jgi:hypothetical protein